MTRSELFNLNISYPSKEIYEKAKRAWDTIAKPLDGLGDFEELICRIAAVQGKAVPSVSNRFLVVFCADNGIVKEGISQSTQEVTLQVARSLGKNISSACCLAKSVNTNVIAVDIGINSDEQVEGVLDMKIIPGTRDFLENPAMEENDVLYAIECGIETAKNLYQDGADLIATGEMGIGNTTTATAVLCALNNLNPSYVTGRGAGLDDEKLQRKTRVIELGIEKYKELFEKQKDDKERAFEVLRCLGGLDIAAMCGLFIGGAIYHVPVVIDGAISAVAALLAEIFVPGSSEYMIASHLGRETSISLVLNQLGKRAYIDGNMALGEGTGALMLMPLLDSALYFYINGLRFEGMGIDQYERFN